MKHALILNCSPVKNGATARIASLAAQTLSPRYETELACIDDYRIGYCRGCRQCHENACCTLQDDMQKLMERFALADVVLCVSPSYWADVPGQFKVFIDRCTPWSNTHEPHATIGAGKKGHAIALRTGPGQAELDRILQTLFHFYGHLDIERGEGLGLAGVECRADVDARVDEILSFCQRI